MSYISKRIPIPRQFPEEEGYRSEYLVSCRNKRQRYIAKFNKAINTVTELIMQDVDIDEINKSNDLLEVIINKIRKVTSEILKHELNDKIKEQDLNVGTTLEFKLIQLRNSIESYTDMKMKPRKSSSSRSHKLTPRAKSPPISEPLHHSVTKKCKSASHADSQKGSHSSSSSKKSSKSSHKSSLAKSSKESLNLSDHTPPSNTSYVSLERRKTAQLDQLLAEQSKERVQRKLLILEKSFELQKEQLLEEAFEAESKVQLATLERKRKPSLNSNESVSVSAHSLSEIVPKDSFDIYKNTRKDIIDEKPDKVTLHESHSQKKVQIHGKLPISKTPASQANLDTDSKVDSKSLSENKNEIRFCFKNTQSNPKDEKLCTVARSLDSFIDDLVEGEESYNHPISQISVSPTLALQQEFESRNLPPIPLIRFDGNPSRWPEFIENFFTRVHSKRTFDDNTRMIRLLSVLDGEAKRTVEAIGCNKIFYATALKTLKRDFGNPLIVAHSRLCSVFDKAQIKANDKVGLRQFHQQLKCNNLWLLSMGYKSSIFSSENLTKAILRLPSHLRNQFYKFTKDSNLMDGSVNLLVFETWLDDQIKVFFNPLADIVNNQDLANKGRLSLHKLTNRTNTNILETSQEVPDSSALESKGNINTIVENTSEKEKKKTQGLKCWLCRENHRLKDCKEFLSKSVKDRKRYINEQKLCWNCLSNKHIVKECKSKFSCSKDSCKKRHHTLIHEEIDNQKEESISNNHVTYQKTSKEKTFLQVISVFASNGETCVQTTALLDSGSDATLISESLANKLQLSGITKDIALTNVLSMTNKFPSKLVNFSISWGSHPEQLPITNAWVVHDLKFSTSPGRVSSAKESYDYLNDIPFDPVESENIELLIGADHPNLHLYTETRSRNHNEPVALHTALGWVLFGGNKKTENCMLNKVTLESATDIIQRFWDIESYGTVPKDDVSAMTVEDKRSIEILKQTTFKSGNHYITGLLWKESNSILPNNKSLALSRLYNLERKLAKHPQIRQMYTETMKEYIKKGYARKLSDKKANTISPRTNYIPHHSVTNINKPNKLRIVFDAAAKFSNTSLN